jgi:hypothetical protein
MRALRLLLVAALTSGALLVLAPVAGATAPAASNAKVCQALADFGSDTPDVTDPEAFDADQFKEFGNSLEKASKQAPKKVKGALVTLASLYKALGGADNAGEAVQEYAKNGQKFGKALGTFLSYYSTNCS